MITLATLGDATQQEVFDQVVGHLMRQGRQSLNATGLCAYRGTDDLMCAAGCLIGKDEYTEEMDNFGQGLDWYNGVSKGIFPAFHQDLITALQQVHDGYFHQWDLGFKEVAAEYGLEYAGA